MKRIIAATLMISLVSLGLTGCNETSKSSTKRETKISTPHGTTTITTESEVKTTEETPPAAKP